MLPPSTRRQATSAPRRLTAVTLALLLLSQFILPLSVSANSTTQTPNPTFAQDWSNNGLITTNDDWSAVPGVVGFLGDYTTGSPTGVDPQTLLQDMTTVDVIANQSNPNVANGAPGGVAEFDGIANPTVALNGSGTADAPNVVFYLNTTGLENVNVAYLLRDLDGSVDDAVQPVALHYRVGNTGLFTNLAGGYVNDATTGPSLATKTTPVNVALPAAANNQPLVQVRVMTTNAGGNDEWVGVDNIQISGSPVSNSTNPTGAGLAAPNTVAAGDATLLTVAVTPGANPPSLSHNVTANLTAIGGSAAQAFHDDGTNGDTLAGDNVFSFAATVANGTSGGAKSLPVVINETSPNARAGSAAITLTVLAPTSPAANGTASPNSLPAGSATLLTVNVTPGANPASTGISVTANLTSIGGASNQTFNDNGNNSFSFSATVAGGTTPGAKSIPVTVADAQNRTAATNITLTVEQPVAVVNHIVISQVYGSGGNNGAAFNRDFVELYNPSTQAFDLAGWSLQYASATGDGWVSNRQPLGGAIAPGEYYLVALAPGATGADVPAANISGEINMSGTAGKIALVRNFDALAGSCPLNDPDLVDFVGYGTTANCSESANAPAPSAANAVHRKGNGAADTDNNQADFIAAAANPRRTSPIVEIGPSVFGTDPRFNGFNAPRDASITVDFTEPVEVAAGWYDINCAVTGSHNDATFSGGGKSHVITPNVNFQAGELCTVTVFKNSVRDTDADDAGANSDTLVADYTWTFTVANGTAPAYTSDVHLAMGNPSGAVADTNQPNNYLMEKPEFALAYDRDKGRPNWVSWHLSDEWVGTLSRFDTFRADPAVPADWYRVQGTDYTGSGFDRGHMVPNADRDKETSVPINQATFLMSNIIPQAPDNNQGPWANMENALRNIVEQNNELYIVAGGAGTGGTGSAGSATTITNGRVHVPAQTWKVVLVLPKGEDDLSRVSCGARTIAVVMPNVQGIRNNDWQSYITTVDAVEALTGYDFFSNLPDAVENCVEAGTNGANPPGTASQNVFASEDTPAAVTLEAVSANDSQLTYTVVGGPAHGTLAGEGASRVYTPAPNFHGADSFTFKVSDGQRESNTSTVSITVSEANDAPTAAADAKNTQEDAALVFSAADLSANDSAGAADEATQVLTVASVAATADTHGTVALAAGQITYTPAPNYHGPASFEYQLCDDGTTGGSPDPKCVNGSVAVTVAPVNDAPTLSGVPASATIDELVVYTFTAAAADADGDARTFSLVGAPAGASINPSTGVFNWTPTEAQGGTGSPYSFAVRVSDGTTNADAPVTVVVGEVNTAPTLAPVGDRTVMLGGTLVFNAAGADADVPTETLAYGLTGAAPAGASINPSTGAFAWTPTAAQAGQVYTFGVRVTDGGGLFAEEVIRVGVGHEWSGVLQPVNADGSSVFKLGRTVPVKFRLTGASAGVTNAVARLYVAKLAGDVAGSEEEADSTSNASEGNLFRYSDGQYVFNLSTDGLTAGTYQLRIDLGDGVARTARVSLR